jgi:hypothetical protein
MNSKTPRPRDTNQLARAIVSLATGETTENPRENGKNPAAVMLGRLGGLKGGIARAKALSAKERSQIATLAAKTRWKTKKSK